MDGAGLRSNICASPDVVDLVAVGGCDEMLVLGVVAFAADDDDPCRRREHHGEHAAFAEASNDLCVRGEPRLGLEGQVLRVEHKEALASKRSFDLGGVVAVALESRTSGDKDAPRWGCRISQCKLMPQQLPRVLDVRVNVVGVLELGCRCRQTLDLNDVAGVDDFCGVEWSAQASKMSRWKSGILAPRFLTLTKALIYGSCRTACCHQPVAGEHLGRDVPEVVWELGVEEVVRPVEPSWGVGGELRLQPGEGGTGIDQVAMRQHAHVWMAPCVGQHVVAVNRNL